MFESLLELLLSMYGGNTTPDRKRGRRRLIMMKVMYVLVGVALLAMIVVGSVLISLGYIGGGVALTVIGSVLFSFYLVFTLIVAAVIRRRRAAEAAADYAIRAAADALDSALGGGSGSGRYDIPAADATVEDYVVIDDKE